MGDHEAFVRHSASGTLRQVLKPVVLSLKDDTLYQIPKNVKMQAGSQTEPHTGNGNYHWVKVIEQPHKASVSAQGLHRINQVAGCAVIQPPTVNVDGDDKLNPYIQRTVGKKGRLGDVVRIVIAVVVVGPAPMTGNPIVVNYTLDYNPAKDFQNMLANVAKYNADYCFLIDEDDFDEWKTNIAKPVERMRWKFEPVHGGVGYAHDLSHEKVAECYSKYIELCTNALKKAQTVARRNAMKAHPALAYTTVAIVDGRARLAIVGWAGNADTQARWIDLMDRVAKGVNATDAEITNLSEAYEPDEDEHDLGPGEVIDAHVVDTDTLERNKLILEIDDKINLLDPSDVAALDYQPSTQTNDVLRQVLASVKAKLAGSS